MGIAVVEKKVSQSLLEYKVEEGGVVENKTWREASRKENWVDPPSRFYDGISLTSLSPLKMILVLYFIYNYEILEEEEEEKK